MIENEELKAKLKKELKALKLNPEHEDQMVKEINYLSNLLIDIYIKKTKGNQNNHE
ncbi:hypothetical protein HY382_01950 [Candidatus Curtissbacteria bacterium]|nr:hypothetical protein [Candidatus Curtissbacteria bacterium]